MTDWLTADEALTRLRLRPQTLYAYVSRGRIEASPDDGDPRRSLYRAGDVARLARAQVARPQGCGDRRGRHRLGRAGAGLGDHHGRAGRALLSRPGRGGAGPLGAARGGRAAAARRATRAFPRRTVLASKARRGGACSPPSPSARRPTRRPRDARPRRSTEAAAVLDALADAVCGGRGGEGRSTSGWPRRGAATPAAPT